MLPEYKKKKTTQIAAMLLSLNNGKMPYLRLLKLLYMIDRLSLERWGEPLTFDKYCSMDHGPVLSRTYDNIKDGNLLLDESYWHEYISSNPDTYTVQLLKEGESTKLSKAEIELIREVYDEYKEIDRWDLSEMTHNLPEYQNPEGSSISIEITDILKAVNKSEEEITEIVCDLEDQAYMDRLFE